jgi:hypothetical protein
MFSLYFTDLFSIKGGVGKSALAIQVSLFKKIIVLEKYEIVF